MRHIHPVVTGTVPHGGGGARQTVPVTYGAPVRP
jgi:hypothetical protein